MFKKDKKVNTKSLLPKGSSIDSMFCKFCEFRKFRKIKCMHNVQFDDIILRSIFQGEIHSKDRSECFIYGYYKYVDKLF